MKNEKTINKLEIKDLYNFDFDKISLSEDIIDFQSKKSNSLYLTLREQYLEWKNILLNILSLSTNKSIALHIMFLVVEIYIKAECVKEFNIVNFTDEIPNVSYLERATNFKLSQIGHNLNHFFNTINDVRENSGFANLIHLLEIKEHIDDLKLADTIKNDYMSLRYNCKKDGTFLCENNLIEEYEIKIIKEVMDNVL